MSNKTRLQSHNTRIQNLINTANSLPDAGPGSGNVEIGVFTINNYKIGNDNINKLIEFPFIVGQTWQEWINSPCNIDIYYNATGINKIMINNYTSQIYYLLESGMQAFVSTDGTFSGLVSLNDLIQNNMQYEYYFNSSDY